jgi:ribosomal protein L37E
MSDTFWSELDEKLGGNNPESPKQIWINRAEALRTALTESRREVEELKALRLCQNCKKIEPSSRAGACASCWFTRYERMKNTSEAENATLRQEVERLKAQWIDHTKPGLGASSALVDSLRRQVEEQAAKLAKTEQAEARAVELEARLPHYHNEKQCGVIAERIERAESSLAAMTKERDEADGWGEEWKRIATEKCDRIKEVIGQRDELSKRGEAWRAERDAALSRAEALEKALERTFHIMDDNYKWVSPDEEQGRVFRKIVEDGLPAFLAAALAAPSEPKEGA